MERRSFLKRTVVAIQGVIALILALPAVRFLIDPVLRSRPAARFHRVAPLSALPVGRALRVQVVAERWDAFVHHPPGPIGQAFLIREDRADGTPSVRCLQTICPHLGCAVDYAADGKGFECHCHASAFDAFGRRVVGPAPRDMDELECRVVGPDAAGESWVEVHYQVFQAGLAAQRAVS